MNRPDGSGPRLDAVTELRSHFGVHLTVMVAVAALLRFCNLGTFSLWLDEILLVLRSRGDLAATWAACAAQREHPPLSALVMSALYGVGLSDDTQRLVPVLLGLGSIALLVLWTRERFGGSASLLTGWLATLSPYHVRYSQELRPYAYLLFFALLTLVLADRVLREPTAVRVALCGLAAAGGLYSHNLFVLVAAPALAVALTRPRAPGSGRGLLALGASALVAVVLYLPWLGSALRLAGRPPSGGAQTWCWQYFTRRWEYLTVAGREGADLTWGGLLVLLLVLAGLVLAVRRWRFGGLPVLAGVAVGIVGVELFYHFVIQRWSAGRYEIIGWPFLVVAAALPLDALLRGRARPAGLVMLLALVVASVLGLADYQRRGREQWQRMAGAVNAVRRPGEPVLTESMFSQYGVAYYLVGADALAGDLPLDGPIPLNRDLARLRQVWPSDRSCLLVRGGAPQSPELRRLASHFPQLATYADSSWLYRLPPQSRVEWTADGRVSQQPIGKEGDWPEPSLTLLPDSLRDRQETVLGRAWRSLVGRRPRPETTRIELDRSSASALLSGWSGFETNPAEVTFVWAVGPEASLVFDCARPRPMTLKVTLWPHQVPGRTQRVRGFVNRHELGEVTLREGSQQITVPVPASALRPGRNLLTFQFAYAVAPADVSRESRDQRPLACAFDRVELVYE